MKGMLAVGAALGLVLVGVTGLATTAVTSGQPSASIPLTAVTADIGPVTLADVAIGGKTLTVLLDTGSYGLRVVADQVPPDTVRRTGAAPEFTFATGVAVSGDLAQASVRIGGRETAGDIPIELVTDTSCVPDRPDCPAAGGKKPVMFGGQFDGIMGVSMRPAEGLVNPLWRLPEGHVFTVHYDPAGASSIVLGEPEAGFSMVHVGKASPTNVPDAPPPWDPAMAGCFTVPGSPGEKHCGPTAFDSGTTTIEIFAPDANGSDVPPGTAVEMSVGDGAFSHTYTTGPGTRAEIIAARGNSIPGLPAFAATDIRYDLAAGTIGFRPR